MVCDREDEIDAFVPEEYWKLGADLKAAAPPPFTPAAPKIDGKKAEVGNGDAGADASQPRSRPAGSWSAKVERKERSQRPSPPFITCPLQQEARGASASGQAHHADRAGALRRQGDRRPRPRRPHHLHAYRLDPRRPTRRSPKCASTSPRHTAPDVLPEKPNVYQCQERAGAGRPRGDPPDLARPAAGAVKDFLTRRGVEALQADLGPLRRLADAAGPLRRHPGGHRERHLTSCAPPARC